MKKSLLSLRGLLTAAIAIITFGANAQTWDFTTLGTTKIISMPIKLIGHMIPIKNDGAMVSFFPIRPL